MSDIDQRRLIPEESHSTSVIVQRAGVSVRQLYYWEAVGLLAPRYQRFGGRWFRRYRQEDLERVLEIKAWLDLGYSLEAVRRMQRAAAQEGAGSAMP